MRTPLLIALAAANALSSPAAARPHGHHHRAERVQAREHHNRRERHHRHHYRAYVAPYRDWSYRSVATGYRLRPAFYGSRYVVSDYGRYGLRAPGLHLRWVRYGPDLLRVDIRTGQVVQVIRGVFY